jgi:hypothetical protein
MIGTSQIALKQYITIKEYNVKNNLPVQKKKSLPAGGHVPLVGGPPNPNPPYPPRYFLLLMLMYITFRVYFDWTKDGPEQVEITGYH